MTMYLVLHVDFDWYTFREPILMTQSLEELKEFLEEKQHITELHQMTWDEYESTESYPLLDDEIPHLLVIKKEITCPTNCHSTRN